LSYVLRLGVLAALLTLTAAAPAGADWLLTPFFGTTFAGQTTLPVLDPGGFEAKHWLIGGSFAWLSDNVVGFEGDVAFAPGVFVDDNEFDLVKGSRATTLSGNVILAVPLAVTRESLRPYLVGGLGLIHAGFEEPSGVLDLGSNELAIQVGGGAIGMVSNRAGLRFDIRQSRTLGRADNLLGERAAKLSFWRATVGVVIRY
jgi:hypothetical protein